MRIFIDREAPLPNALAAAESRRLRIPDLMAPASPGLKSNQSVYRSRRAFSAPTDQHIRRDTEAFVQASDHRDRRSAFSVQNPGDAGACTNDCLQVPPRESLLLHAEFDGIAA
jgi:hypothetical protein